MFERKYSSARVVAKLAWIKVLVGEIRIGPGVGQRFGSPRVKVHSWQKGILVTGCGKNRFSLGSVLFLTDQSNVHIYFIYLF